MTTYALQIREVIDRLCANCLAHCPYRKVTTAVLVPRPLYTAMSSTRVTTSEFAHHVLLICNPFYHHRYCWSAVLTPPRGLIASDRRLADCGETAPAWCVSNNQVHSVGSATHSAVPCSLFDAYPSNRALQAWKKDRQDLLAQQHSKAGQAEAALRQLKKSHNKALQVHFVRSAAHMATTYTHQGFTKHALRLKYCLKA